VSRMFVALQPPDDAIEHLDEFLDVRREAAGFRWATTEQMHVTLAFLAMVPPRRVDELVERLTRAAARRTAFDTRITGGGAFPGPADARVLWAGLELDEHGRTELTRLATGTRAAAAKAGIEAAATGRGDAVGAVARRLRRSTVARGPDRARRVVPRPGPARTSSLRDGRHIPAEVLVRSVGSGE
jgi:hypothetical protein